MNTAWINKWLLAGSWFKKPSHLFLDLIFRTPYLLPVPGTRNTESYIQALMVPCPLCECCPVLPPCFGVATSVSSRLVPGILPWLLRASLLPPYLLQWPVTTSVFALMLHTAVAGPLSESALIFNARHYGDVCETGRIGVVSNSLPRIIADTSQTHPSFPFPGFLGKCGHFKYYYRACVVGTSSCLAFCLLGF